MTDLTELASVLAKRKPANHPIAIAHADLLWELNKMRPPRIYTNPIPEDFEAVGDYLADVLDIVSTFFKRVGDEVQSNSTVKLAPFALDNYPQGECTRAAEACREDREEWR